MRCRHPEVRRPPRPIPDWTGTCPDCGEHVKHDGRGGFITVREVNARIAEEQRAVAAFRERWRAEHPPDGIS